MSKNHLISVILPVYNGDNTLSSAILSIQNQTYQNWELIILDDGSQDSSQEIACFFASQDKRLQFFRQSPNRGLAYTMNHLTVKAQGKYIAVQEQDDISMPLRLEKELEILESNPDVGLVSGIADWIDERNQHLNFFPGMLVRGEQFPQDNIKMVKLLYVEQSKIVNAACMFRKEILNGLDKPFDEQARMSIDWQFFLHVAHKNLVWGIPEVLVKMRRGNTHVHLTKNKELMFSEARRCIKKIYTEYHQRSDSPINLELYRKAMAHQITMEGRAYGRVKGLVKLLIALTYDPGNSYARQSLKELLDRGIKKFHIQT